MVAVFPLAEGRTYLNHASYGAPTIRALKLAETERYRIEADSAQELGPRLQDRLRDAAATVSDVLSADRGSVTLTANSTEACGALIRSLPLSQHDHVVLFDGEYQSVVDGWRRRCTEVGAHLTLLPLHLPATVSSVLEAVTAVKATAIIVSAITSSTSLRMPLTEIGVWAAGAGIRLIIDAAHVVGHDVIDLTAVRPTAMFGTLHKWLPVPRSVGFLWLSDELVDVVRPAVVSLNSESSDLSTRFGWRGTWDPAAALGVQSAVDENRLWVAGGQVQAAGDLADVISRRLLGPDFQPTGSRELMPPRMRAFLSLSLNLDQIRERLSAANIRAWSGADATGRPIVRFSTNVYNNEQDVESVAAAFNV